MYALLVAGTFGGAQASDVPGIEDVRFRTFSTEEGLSQATARAIAQDSSGFIWIGTQDGLNRFDGHNFRIYRHDRSDPHSLAQNHVWDIVPDADGDLWIATQGGGLGRYDAELDRFDNVRADPARSDALAANHVTALLLDRAQRLWVASVAGRLQWLDRGSGRFSDVPIGALPALRMVRAMLQSRDGSIWLGTHDGLLRLDAHGRTRLPLPAEVAHLDIFALAEASDATVWIGTLDAGVVQVSADGRLLQHLRHDPGAAPGESLPDDAVRGILPDPDGTLWFTSSNRGLSRYDPKRRRFGIYRHDAARDYTIAGNRLWGILRERSGLLVVGSWVNGFSIHDPRTRAFTLIDAVAGEPRALPSRAVPSVHADADGTLWIGLSDGGGLVHLDPQRGVLRRYVHDPADPGSLSHDFVQSLTRGRDGSLWVATVGGGLNRLRAGATRFEHYRHDPHNPGSLAADALVFVSEDRAGTLWVGTLDHGLDELCGGCDTFRHHAHDPADAQSIAGDTINGVLETRRGDFYLAYRSAGLGRFDRKTGRATPLRPRDGALQGLGNDSVAALHEDRNGRLWVGMQGGGLALLEDPRDPASPVRPFGTRQGLAADAIGEIAEDERGLVWVSTTVGISRIDPDSGRIVNFGRHAGALSRGYWARSMAQLPDGRIAFGGLDGLTLVDPRSVSLAPPAAPIVTSLLLNNVPAELRWRDANSPLARNLVRGGDVALRHDDDNVTFEFVSPYFAGAESLRYAYRLDPHDARWIEADHRRLFATYTDLSAGNYRLRVRVRRDAEDWIAQEGGVTVVVAAAPWASPWAFVLYAALAGAGAFVVAQRLRASRRAREQVQERIQLSEERLKLALTGSGSELWDIDLPSGRMHRENRMEHVAATADAAEQSLSGFRPFVHPDDLDAFEAQLAAHLRGQTPVFEASYRTPDRQQEWVWLLTRGRVVDVDERGHARRMSGITQDITALKRAEAALRALNEELELRVERRTSDLRAANVELQHTLDRLTLTQRQLLESEKLASLGGLVAGIAHEINTPLGVGITAASHLAEEATRLTRLLQQNRLGRGDLDRFQQTACESAEMILRNLRRADALVKSFKQVAVDQSTEDRRVVELGACVSEILTTLGPTLKKTPHRVELVCAQPVVCETAPGALYQIVTNLVMNSLIHGFADGRPGRIVVAVARDAGAVAIDYRDDGVGMDEATRARIFDPFFTTRRGQGGSGLGMHIVYNLVTQSLGGSIRVDSAAGQGIEVAIRFGGERHGAG
ncbi:MAG TPA: two-component regulator propeller domain-containing protein [Tahibacter sp.]|uniref:two-component regulator propeller domain-containing protein n=1 Tax=Tahibacter sp. TaxID=2056211 RepID=UPI002B9B3FD8|nr:two-component regulator propeller domain-containing protein [Tahibacter sp.]HSX59380.1 two-component regulator propeller domain-containing protein [Tahibacter sp.]